MTTRVTLLIALILTLLLASCISQAAINEAAAIKAAKEATQSISSPPSLYYIDNHIIAPSITIRSWPDLPSSKQGIFDAGGAFDKAPITFTTSINVNDSGYNVTFKSEWLTQRNYTHSWLFHVNADRKAEFVREERNQLPSRPERG